MGGRIWVESEPGKGSTFFFTVCLPLAQELPAGFESPATVSAVACAQLHILLVEDNPANQKLATYLLQDRGHTIEIAGDGQEAIRRSGQTDYDVILMDVQMPGMDGLEATAAIRRREDGKPRVPIIAMTAHAMKGDRDRCLAAGMDAYLSKPINAQELIDLVERLGGASAAARIAEPGRSAHRLKGTVVYLGALPAKEAASHVENVADSGQLADLAVAIDQLAAEVARLKQALAPHRRR